MIIFINNSTLDKQSGFMTQKNKIFRNILIGAGIGLIIGLLLMYRVILRIIIKEPVISPGAELRGVEMIVVIVIWGALMGFCCTRSENYSKKRKYLLVILGAITSMCVVFLWGYDMIRTSDDIMVISIYMIFLAAISAFIIAKYQFSKVPPNWRGYI